MVSAIKSLLSHRLQKSIATFQTMQCCSNTDSVTNRKLPCLGRRSWSWTMLCPHQKEPPGVKHFQVSRSFYLIWLQTHHFHVSLMCSAVAIRSRWYMCERGLHSQKADAPDSHAEHGHAGCTQVRLGVRGDR